ncbi:MAG: hypothetical protein SGCHY_002414 [Lobulomycetales sp.]
MNPDNDIDSPLSLWFESKNSGSRRGTYLPPAHASALPISLVDICVAEISAALLRSANSDRFLSIVNSLLPDHLVNRVFQRLTTSSFAWTLDTFSSLLRFDATTEIKLPDFVFPARLFKSMAEHDWIFLTCFRLNHQPIKEAALVACVQRMPVLVLFEGSGNLNLGDDLCRALVESCTMLEYVNLSMTGIGQVGLTSLLCRLPCLKTLKVASLRSVKTSAWRRCIKTEETADSDKPNSKRPKLSHVPPLANIKLRRNEQVSDAVVQSLVQRHLDSIRVLDMMLTGTRPGNLGLHRLRNLEKLNVTGTSIRAGQLPGFIKSLLQHTQIKVLLLGNMPDLTDAAFADTRDLLVTRLERLSLFACPSFGSAGLLNILSAVCHAGASAKLENLDVSRCGVVESGYDDHDFPQTQGGSSPLKLLNLSNTKVGDGFCQLLASRFPALKWLDLTSTRITTVGLDSLLESLSLDWICVEGCRGLKVRGVRSVVHDRLKALGKQ